MVSLSLALTCISVQAGDERQLEKADNSGESNTQRSYGIDDKVELISANLAYDINAKKLLDMNVIDKNGKKLGEIDDLILSAKDQIVHVLVSVGGVLGVGGKLVAIPFQDMDINKDEAVINLTEEQLGKVTEFKFEYVRDRNYQTKDRPVASGTEGKHSAASISYDINVKKLFDLDVVDRYGKQLGKIDDLLLSKNDKVVTAILSVGGVLGIGDKLVAVPFQSLQVNQPDEKILLNVTKEQLEQAAEFKFRNK